MSFLCAIMTTAIQFLSGTQVHSIYFPQVNKSLTSGFQIFFMVWLGRAEITPVAICSKLFKAAKFVFFLPIFLQKELKKRTLEEVTPKRRYQFGDVVMSKGCKLKIISRHTNL